MAEFSVEGRHKRLVGNLNIGDKFKRYPHQVTDREIFVVTDLLPSKTDSVMAVSIITGKGESLPCNTEVWKLD